MHRNLFRCAALAVALLCGAPASGQTPAAISPRAAERTPFATRAMLLDAARAGTRIVAVGDRGVVLLSDDHGKSFRQAASVPVNATLTSVSFVDDKHGWAVGHWGAILATADGGETWQQQRLDTGVDRPLFAVHFSDVQHGIAVGLWSLLLVTGDGGATWQEVALAPPPGDTRADRNLLAAFADARGALYVAGERGTVLKSTDLGRTWTYRLTGYRGSFWTGTALADGTILVAGLRGTVYRSPDGGDAWAAVDTRSRSSITDIAAAGGHVVAVGLDGLTLDSTDGGASFRASQRPDRLALTALLIGDNPGTVLFSRAGVVPADPK